MAKYLYNGVELPALPEWDKETYPYAVMGYYSDTRVRVVFCMYPSHIIGSSTGEKAEPNNTGGTGIAYYYNLGEANWEYDGNTVLAVDAQVSRVFWTNHDLYYEDEYYDDTLAGTLYLAASDPVPVTPTPADLFVKKGGTLYKTSKVCQVRTGALVLQEKTVTENGEVTADEGYEGLSKVTVNVPTYIAVATEEEATDTATIPIVDGQVIVVTGA